MKKLFKNWNTFELILLLASIFLIFILGVAYQSEVLTMIASFLGIFCALLQAKGKVVSQLVGLIEVIFYSMLSFRNQYYGEVIIYIVIMLPLYCIGIYSWITHKKEESDTVEQNTITRKEGILLGIGNAILFVILYFVLRYFNTSQLIVSTFSMVTSLTATYLIMRRSKYSFLFYILNDIILLILWGTPVVLHQDFTLIPIAMEPLILLVNDTYGWKNWNKGI